MVMLVPLLASGCFSPPTAVAQGPQAPPPGSAAGAREALTVGPGKAYALPSQAALASRRGDVIKIFPGTYTDCARWDADGLTIEGAGPNVIIADKVCNNKGLFITRGNDITIRNITFRSARASSHNGSGIRAEGNNLTVEDSRFIDDEDGILAGDNAASIITIKNSYFRGNGNCIAACAHGIYAGHIALLRVEGSTFEEQHVGHHIKSRAARTEIINNSVQDGPNGSASYLVDMPNGGSAMISGNTFEKGPLSENKNAAISIGAEKAKGLNLPGDIVIEDNVFSNDTGVATAFVKNYTDGPVTLQRNRFSGAVTPLGRPDPSEESAARPAP